MASSNSNDALRLKLEGNELFKARKYEEALKKYKKACELCPSVPTYWSNAAACYEKLQDFEGMKEAASHCVEADESFVKGYYRLAVASQELEELTAAKEAIDRATELDSNDDAIRLLKIQIEDLMELFKCQECGKADKTSVCSRCNMVSYCSRDCQVKAWKVHKKTCKPPSDDNLLAGNVNCQNCMKLLKNPRRCSKCEAAHYCSRKCQIEAWPEHKHMCRSNRKTNETAEALGQSSSLELFNTWRSRAKIGIGLLATHAMTKKQFMEQPPSFVVSIVVDFNYNCMTYLPVGDPQVVPISSLPDQHRANATMVAQQVTVQAQAAPDRSFGHVFFITSSQIRAGALMPQMLLPASFQRYPREGIESLIRAETNLNPAMLQSWQTEIMNNLKAQLNALKMADALNWSNFLVHALRVYSSQPRFKTHALLVDYKLGFGLGQVDKVAEYKVITLDKARDLFRKNPQFPQVAANHIIRDSLDVENSPKLLQSRVARPRNVLLAVIFRAEKSENVLMADPQLYELEHGMPVMPPNQCDKKANACFRRLQTVSLPDVVSPSLSNVKPV